MRKIITILICFCVPCFLSGGQIFGKFQLRKNGELITEGGEVFVGEITQEDKNKFYNFPDYLISMIDSIKNSRVSRVDNNGEFLVKDVPSGKKIVVGFTLSSVDYFYEGIINEGDSLKIEIILDLDKESNLFVADIKNKTGVAFISTFGDLTYLIEKGSSGRIFSGSRIKNDKVDFGEVPLGSYNLYVLNEVDEDKPNRVDVISVEVTKDNNNPVIFEIK